MTRDEFLERYHEYLEQDVEAAKREAAKVNEAGDGFTVEAVEMPRLGWCLMTDRAARLFETMRDTSRR